ncbi:MAG: LexA family transcriptional regulator [Elusimicrobia bacterium]|nr:LexA family transcriptional regulator [Elusimicrobiota bacterium]
MFVASEDYNDVGLRLDERLIKRPAATFFLRAAGSAPDADVKDGDLLIVDRAEPPAPGRVVVAVLRGELLARRLPPGWRADDGLEIWGVVAYVVRAP